MRPDKRDAGVGKQRRCLILPIALPGLPLRRCMAICLQPLAPPWRGVQGFFKQSVVACCDRRLCGQAFSLTLSATLLLCSCLSDAANAAPFAYVSNEGSGSVTVIDTADDTVVAQVAAGAKPRGLAVAGKWLFVSDQVNNRLQTVDLANQVAGPAIDLGESPEGVYASADGRWIAAAIERNNEVAFIDAHALSLAFKVKVVGRNPEHAVFSPDGTTVLVSAEEGESIDIIDFASRREIGQVKVGARPRGIGFLPDGSRAYVACENSNQVDVIDLRT
ncbi:MAG: hypothetical protein ACRYGK_03700, partial [Janthinobacterium lividum]